MYISKPEVVITMQWNELFHAYMGMSDSVGDMSIVLGDLENMGFDVEISCKSQAVSKL